MADIDGIEFRLYDTDFITVIAILPVAAGSRLYLELNEPGSGMVVIPNDCAAAALVTENQFIAAYYRGAYRGGFLVDNIETVGASSGEGGDKWMQISGRGPLALLNEAIIWPEDTAKTTREFDDYKWSTMFIFLFAEASMRGAVANITLDWTDAIDSSGTAWTDTGYYSYTNGESLLDVLRDIAKLGYEFTMTFGTTTPGWFTLHAYKNPTGTDRSETIYMRVGTNCEEVGVSEKSDELANAYLIKYAKSYTSTEDPVSIAANRRREKLYHSDEASSPTLARQWGNAMLDNTTDPKKEIRVKVYDGLRPYAFVEYSVGDTVVLDNKGTETDYRLRGMELEWDNDQYASITLSLNSSFVEYELRVAQEMERLKRLYTKAHDSNLLEVSFWAAIAEPQTNGIIYAIAQVGNEIFFGGVFTAIANITCNNLASYNIATGEWTSIGSFATEQYVYSLAVIGTDLYIGFYALAATANSGVLKWNGAAMSALGSGLQDEDGDFKAAYALAVIGTDLYVGGDFLTAGTVANTYGIAKWATATSTWSALGTGMDSSFGGNSIVAMAVIGTDLYIGGAFARAGGVVVNNIAKWNGTIWSAFANNPNNTVQALATDGTNLYAGGWFTQVGTLTVNYIAAWDGSNWSALGSGMDSAVFALFADQINLYAGGDFVTVNGATINHVAQWDGYNWYDLAGGTDDVVWSLYFAGSTLYVGGEFLYIGEGDGLKVAKAIGAYITSFNPLMENLNKGQKRARWGQIGGTLSDQLDLQAELDTKVDSIGTANGLSIAGQVISLAAATAATPGAATAAQITKLDGIEAGAEVNNISDVNATDLTDGGATTLHTHGYQPLDAFLTSIGALGTAANKILVTTGVDAAAEYDITAAARALLADTNVPRLGTANVFTAEQTLQATVDAALSAEYITAIANRDFSAATNWSGTNWIIPLSSALIDVTVAAAGKTFTRVSGSFIADGFQVGMSVTWSGFAKAGTTNNGTFVITTLTALVMTCSAAALTDEVPADYVSVTATSPVWSHAVAGANAASLANGNLTAAPANGDIFQITITVVTKTANTLTISIGGTAMASVIGKVVGTLTAYVFNIVATGAGALTITPGATWLGWIDNISVKKITPASSILTGKMLAGSIGLETIVSNATSLGVGVNTLKGSVQVYCTAAGMYALYQNTGANSTAAGAYALYLNTGAYCTAAGMYALYQNTGANSTAAGAYALRQNTGANCTAAGAYALYQNTGANSTAAGAYALYQNTGVNCTAAGYAALYLNTGAYCTAAGYAALYLNTGAYCTAAGMYALYLNTGVNCTAAGYAALYLNTGAYCTAAGMYALYLNTGVNCTAAGAYALRQNTGANCTAAGYAAGRYVADGVTARTTGDGGLFLGANTRALGLAQNNQIVIGTDAIGAGANSVVLGNTSIAATLLRGNVGVASTLAGAGVTYQKLSINGSQLFVGADSTQESPMFQIVPSYVVNTHASYTTRTIFSQWAIGGAQEIMRFESGAAAMIGFLGAAAVVRQTGCAVPTDLASCIASVTALRTALNNLGLTTIV